MTQFGGKLNKSSSSDSKRNFTVIMGDKEHGLYVSSTPSSAAKKAVTKFCASNKSKKVEFHIREITQGSKKKTYGPYLGYIEKLKEPIELKGRVIKYKPVAKLIGKSGAKKGGMIGGAPKAQKDEKKMGLYNVSSNNNNGNPEEGPAPRGIYNYVPSNNFSHSAAFPVPSAPPFANINNNFRNPLEGLVATAPAFDEFNNLNNPAAGPALNRSLAHRGFLNKKIVYPFRDLLLHTHVKVRNPEQLNVLVKLINFIEKWKRSWKNSNVEDCFDEFLEKFEFPYIGDRMNTLTDIKRRLIEYVSNKKSLDNIKIYIQKILLKNPTWRRFLKDNNSSSRSDAVDNTSLAHILNSRSDDIIVLPVDNNIYQKQPQKIPEYHIRNQNPNFVAAKHSSNSWRMYGKPFDKYAIPEDVFNYKQKLKKLAAEMAKKHIFWADRSGTIEKSVRFLLEEHYINPTPEQIDNAIKAVRMFLLPTKNRELHRKIMENNFDVQPLSAADATAAADADAPITDFEKYQLYKNPSIKKLILTLKAMGLDKNEYKNEVIRRLRSRGFKGRQYNITYKYLIDSYNN